MHAWLINVCIAQQMSEVSHFLLRGPDARVHWWYWPDSYDSWIPVDQAPDADDPDKPSRGQYCIPCTPPAL